MKPLERPDSPKWDFNSEKWNLWPWKYWMTVGIGVLCSEGKERPDHVILACDTLGSFGDVNSTLSLHKLFSRRDARIYAVAARDMGKAAELVTKIANTVKKESDGTYGRTYDVICLAVHDYKSARFRYEVVTQHGLKPVKGWMEKAKEVGVLDELLKTQWPKFSMECELIVGTFAEDYGACLFYVQDIGMVHPITTQNFVAIGTGAPGALFWLCCRDQLMSMGVRRSAYHVYEAKLMAERSPHVGKGDIQLLIANAKRADLLTASKPESPGCAVSLTELEGLREKYGPKKTDDLDLGALA
jgi:hypothetical protein